MISASSCLARIPRAAALLALVLLSACRMPVVVHGKGFVFGETALQVYKNGYVFEINEDFEEDFWPVPSPGSYFKSWNRICSVPGNVECQLALDRELWRRDEEIPLELTFGKNYSGPLTLIDYELYWLASTRTLSIPEGSLLLEGVEQEDSPRLFLAPPNLKQILPGVLRGGYYNFQLPAGSPYQPEDFWLFVSARDSQGTVATVGYGFGLFDELSIEKLRPYKAQSPWADALVDCATASDVFNLCSMKKLPYLGSVKPEPSVSDIMARVVVSHPWMGLRFSQVLQQLPPTLLNMFRGVTAIVISSDVRPAFFTVATGAIYLDPQDLWLTPAERETVDWAPDYRSDFGDGLAFTTSSYYVDGGQAAWRSSSDYGEGSSRTTEDIIPPMAWLLAHELAHANDAVPPSLLPDPGSNKNPIDVFLAREPQTPSVVLENTYPLNSDLLHRVGGVLFHGEIADGEILALTAEEVGLEFAADSANALYAYSTPFEDTASLVEEVLMNYFYDVEKLEAFLDSTDKEDPECDDYTLRWGSLSRASEPQIRERARLVLGSILGESDVSKYLDAVPPATQLTTGIGLCSSLESLEAPIAISPGTFREPPRVNVHNLARSHQHIKSHERVTGPRPRNGDVPH